MDRAEVIAIEVKQFMGGRLKTLVPRLIGQTAKSAAKDSHMPIKEWDEASFMEVAEREGTPNTARICKRLIEWFTANGCVVLWMKGKPHFAVSLPLGDGEFWILEVWADGKLMLLVKNVADEQLKEGLRSRMNKIKGIKLTKALKEPCLDPDLEPLAEESTWRSFVDVLHWCINEVKANPAKVTLD
jgi:hypothetical protein